MTRKDTILIAVVINAGLLAILFTTAIIYDTDKLVEQNEFMSPILDNTIALQTPTQPPSTPVVDEVDNVLQFYSQPPAKMIAFAEEPQEEIPEPVAVQSNLSEEDVDFSNTPELNYVEIVVKKGDVLEKIARANGTTTSELKRMNHLPNEKLSIGQVLKVPTNVNPQNRTNATRQMTAAPVEDVNGAVYYVVKSGDNPWKIARQYHVKFEDILKLNHLDEEKARNLKVGDRIRVK